MSFHIINEDITKLNVDAIVNAANTALQMGGGVCGAIFRAAGPLKLEEACNKLSPIKTGQAVITSGFNLDAKYIIHTAGPIYNPEDRDKSRKLLEDSYNNSLKLVIENKINSIAFPLISAGIYGYPKEEAFEVAKSTIENFLVDNEIKIYLTIFDQEFFNQITNK